MGMFDVVVARCGCGAEVEFQSKASDCNLDRYSVHQVPIVIAIDLLECSDVAVCDNCGKKYRIYSKTGIPVKVDMYLLEV